MSGQRVEKPLHWQDPLVQSSSLDQARTLLPLAALGSWPSCLRAGWSLDPYPDDGHIGIAESSGLGLTRQT